MTGGIGQHVILGLVWLAWAPFLAWVAYGQSATASLRGAVTDERGAAIANAAVTVTDAAKAVSRKAVTDSDGLFVVAQLPPSRYRIRVEQNGFAVAELPDLALNVGEQATVRVQMKVAQVGEVVTISEASVVGDSPAVATTSCRAMTVTTCCCWARPAAAGT